jgi:hypothetical protein
MTPDPTPDAPPMMKPVKRESPFETFLKSVPVLNMVLTSVTFPRGVRLTLLFLSFYSQAAILALLFSSGANKTNSKERAYLYFDLPMQAVQYALIAAVGSCVPGYIAAFIFKVSDEPIKNAKTQEQFGRVMYEVSNASLYYD